VFSPPGLFTSKFTPKRRQTLVGSLLFLSFESSKMSLKVALYGITRDIVGAATIELPAPAPTTVAGLLAEMRRQYPALGQLRSCAVAVNNEYAEADHPLTTVDEIALIPPVAGG
jgi:molybdopterin synthase sulfur carrier subunit